MKITSMKNALFLLSTIFAVSILFPGQILAKRLLPHAVTVTKPTGKVVSTTKGVATKVKFRSDRRAIVVNFSNLAISKKVDYMLSYQSRGVTQGASGSINTSSVDPVAREVLFGTCSHNICRYDSGITNAKFVVTTTLSNGTRVSKSFKLKV